MPPQDSHAICRNVQDFLFPREKEREIESNLKVICGCHHFYIIISVSSLIRTISSFSGSFVDTHTTFINKVRILSYTVLSFKKMRGTRLVVISENVFVEVPQRFPLNRQICLIRACLQCLSEVVVFEPVCLFLSVLLEALRCLHLGT